MSSLSDLYQSMPQLLTNIPVTDRAVMDSCNVQQAIMDVSQQLGSRGRIVVRPSGTEPLIRVMAEAETMQEVQSAVDIVSESIRNLSA